MLLFCMMVCTAGYAKTVGFVCMYNSDAPTGAVDLTAALETELFDLCFDRGIIATSGEYITGNLERYKDNSSFIQRFDSPPDLVIALYCEYMQGPRRGSNSSEQAINWKKVQWKIIDFSVKSVRFEESINPETLPESDLKQKVKSIGKTIGAKILENL